MSYQMIHVKIQTHVRLKQLSYERVEVFMCSSWKQKGSCWYNMKTSIIHVDRLQTNIVNAYTDYIVNKNDDSRQQANIIPNE
jgi:hypothetical protein